MPEPITSWTSAGMSWASLGRKLLYPYIEALRLALVERCAAAGETVPAILQDPLPPGTTPRAAWGIAFDTTMDALFPRYLNHQTHLQNWSSTSLSDIIGPTWNEADLLAATGALHRLHVSANAPFFAGWALQQYAFLNLLRWVGQYGTYSGGQIKHVQSGSFAVGGGSSSDLVARWPAMWEEYADSPLYQEKIQFMASVQAKRLGGLTPLYWYTATRVRSRATCPTALGVSGLPVRGYVVTAGPGDLGAMDARFDAQGTGYAEGVVMIADTTTTTAPLFASDYLANVDSVPPSIPAESHLDVVGQVAWWMRTKTLVSSNVIHRPFFVIDYSGGFAFIAP